MKFGHATRERRAVLTLVALACMMSNGLSPGAVHAETSDVGVPAGTLTCVVATKFESGVAANRMLNCRFWRAADHRVELYTGYTGIIGVGIGPSAPYEITFDVVSPAPTEEATLEGDFRSRLSSAGELAGGSGVPVVLRFDPAAAPPVGLTVAPLLAPLNAIAGFGYFHLIYAGVAPSKALRKGAR